MAAVLNVLQETVWGDILAEVVVGVRGQPEVAVHQRHKGQCLCHTLELGFLLRHVKETMNIKGDILYMSGDIIYYV